MNIEPKTVKYQSLISETEKKTLAFQQASSIQDMQQHSLLAVKIPFGFGHRRQNWGRGTQGTCTPDYGEWTSHALVPRKLYAA